MALTLRYRERPEIVVILKKGDKELIVPGYVDSGSDITYVPFQIARTLGLKARGQNEEINTGGGHKVDVLHTSLDLIICDDNLEEK
jgi:electron transfer flavoprotein alpha/beta subunit